MPKHVATCWKILFIVLDCINRETVREGKALVLDCINRETLREGKGLV